jgi:sec-independent protein translocase protein TatA
MFGSFGFTELLIILLIVIIIFGVNKLPKLGKNLGEGIMNFKSAIKAITEDPDQGKSTEKTPETPKTPEKPEKPNTNKG